MSYKLPVKITSTDIIAAILIMGGLYLKLQDKDGMVTAFITLIVGYYFGHKREYEKQLQHENT